MKRCLFACLFSVIAYWAFAQSETCPRVWRGGDTLWTDPAPAIQWLRDGAALPGENERWLVPTKAGRYSVVVGGGFSSAFPYEAGAGYVIAGYVFDELHRPVEGASVRRGAFSATTDEKGRFALEISAPKPAERTPVVVTVEKDGYWRNASRQYVSAPFRTTETQIMLHTRRVTNRVDATKGGEMAYRGFTLQLPPNAVQTESGTPYSGTILLSVEGATPSDPDFGLRMPGGDFAAIDEDGNDVMLYSYGYLSAEMTTEGGEKLELRPEARANLRFYLPYTETHRPDSVPLWHFNTETAVWEQEGWSVRNGSIYQGQVSHFSSWNCDIPAERGTCEGRVIDCQGEPVMCGWVRVGQRNVITDSLGDYWTYVPGGIAFDAFAVSDTLRGVTVSVREERRLADLTGIAFGGVAAWNPTTQTLSVHLSGNLPQHLRLSIDGGQSWTTEREFSGLEMPPPDVRTDDGCVSQLRVATMSMQGDCRKLTENELEGSPWFLSLAEALSADLAIRLHLMGNFGGEWNLLPQLTCLQSLSITSSQMRSLPESLGSLVQLRALLLNNNELIELPESIGNLTQLAELNLTDNRLSALPESIGNFAQLKVLYLGRNQLASLPESIGNLVQLQELYLQSNQLRFLPDTLGNLSRLRTLWIDGAQLGEVPDWISGLTQLQSVNLSATQLRAAPEWIGSLTQLERLYLSYNQLTELPASIGDLNRLQMLDLYGNQLTDLPPSIANLAGVLQNLYLQSNPIPVERRAAIQAMLPNTRIYWE